MTKKLLDERIKGADYISSGPTNINNLEGDVADLLGFDTEQLYADAPFSFDSDGNIVSERAGDSLQTIFKDSEGVVGFRLWDTTNDKEIFISMENDQLVIYENTASPLGESAVWRERFNVGLDGGENDDPGQSFLNHIDVPASIVIGEYLRGNSAGDALEFAAFDAATPDSCGVSGSQSIGDAANASDWKVFATLTETWDNDGSMVVADTADYIEIQTAGIYLITMNGAWPASGSGHRGIGYHGAATGGISKLERVNSTDFGDGTPQVFGTSWVESLSLGDKLYPKAWQDSGGALTITLNRFSVTKISQE